MGFFEALLKLFKFKKNNTLVFSTGGFVSVPVVLAAKCLGMKVYIHEQTSRVGLANKICSFFADKVFVSFKDSVKFFPKNKTYYSGYPVREECFNSEIGPIIINEILLNESVLPLLFITGGGNGAKLLNELVKSNLAVLSKKFIIVHQVGSNYLKEYSALKNENYFPVAFIGKEMIDLFKLSACTVSRSGAGTVCELLAVGKRSVFIPLKIAQKNEQYFNAQEAKNTLDSIIINEDELNNENFLNAINEVSSNNKELKSEKTQGLDFLINEIQKAF
jgi:UDP-N-acetylglucosamine--N-acetylmuramyl-(pentapeptide) pyrophosphoryl-undecaprenol N-acetylglucosamine transferase